MFAMEDKHIDQGKVREYWWCVFGGGGGGGGRDLKLSCVVCNRSIDLKAI